MPTTAQIALIYVPCGSEEEATRIAAKRGAPKVTTTEPDTRFPTRARHWLCEHFSAVATLPTNLLGQSVQEPPLAGYSRGLPNRERASARKACSSSISRVGMRPGFFFRGLPVRV